MRTRKMRFGFTKNAVLASQKKYKYEYEYE